jgi:hypothetical protein
MCVALRVATVDNGAMVCMLPNEALTDAGYHALLRYDKVHRYAGMRAARAWDTQQCRSERHDVTKTTTSASDSAKGSRGTGHTYLTL